MDTCVLFKNVIPCYAVRLGELVSLRPYNVQVRHSSLGQLEERANSETDNPQIQARYLEVSLPTTHTHTITHVCTHLSTTFICTCMLLVMSGAHTHSLPPSLSLSQIHHRQ